MKLLIPNLFKVLNSVSMDSFHSSFVYENENGQIEFNELEKVFSYSFITGDKGNREFHTLGTSFKVEDKESMSKIVELIENGTIFNFRRKSELIEIFGENRDVHLKHLIYMMNPEEKDSLLFKYMKKDVDNYS